jgi:hypothetical protein
MRATSVRPMRAALAALALAAFASMLSGCGNHTLTLFVDVMSFLSPSDTQTSIQPHVPPTPTPGAWLSEDVAPPLIDDLSVRLFSGTGDVVDVRSVTLRFAVEATDSSGSGADTLRVYMSGPATPPRPGTPLAVAPVVFAAPPGPGAVSVDTVSITIDQSAGVAKLFTGSTVRLTVTNAIRGPVGIPGVDPGLAGRVRIIQLDATVIAGHKPM